MTEVNKFDEQVLVAGREWVFQFTAPFRGLLTDKLVTHDIVKQFSMYHTFKRRGDMETNADFKQLIPYVMIRRNKEYLTYRRLSGGGEERLFGTRSLGFGGHMNEIRSEEGKSVRFKEKILGNLWRELEEELKFTFKESDCTLEFVGVINDDEDAAGLYHIGLAAVLDIPSNAEIDVREDEAHEIEFMSVSELSDHLGEFESWSQFLVHQVNDWGSRG